MAAVSAGICMLGEVSANDVSAGQWVCLSVMAGSDRVGGGGGTVAARGPRRHGGGSGGAPSRRRRRRAARRRPPTRRGRCRYVRLPAAGDLDPVGVGPVVPFAQCGGGVVEVGRDPEVRPPDPLPISGLGAGDRRPVRWMVRVGDGPAGVGRRSPRPRTRRPDGSSSTPAPLGSHRSMVATSPAVRGWAGVDAGERS